MIRALKSNATHIEKCLMFYANNANDYDEWPAPCKHKNIGEWP